MWLCSTDRQKERESRGKKENERGVTEWERHGWKIMVLYFPGEAQNVEFSDPVMGANHSSTLRICIFVSGKS